MTPITQESSTRIVGVALAAGGTGRRPSTGAVVAAIPRLPTEPGDIVVAISAHSGFKYTSYFGDILGEEGKI